MSLPLASMSRFPAGAAEDTAPSALPSSDYEDALAYFNDRDYQSAIVQLKRILKEEPRNLSARILIGKAFLAIGSPHLAETELRRARVDGADQKLTLVPLGKALLEQGKYNAVFDELPAGRFGPSLEADILVVHGKAHLELGEVHQAAQAFEEADRLRPGYGDALLGRAKVALARARVDAAETLVNTVLASDSRNAQAWYLRGDIRRRHRALPDAVAAYDRAIELDPDNLLARIGRAAALVDLGRRKSALEDIQYVRAKAPRDLYAAYLFALVLASDGDRQGAQDALQDVGVIIAEHKSEILLKNPGMSLIAGTVSFALGKRDDAEVFLRRYTEIAPHHLPSRKTLARILLDKGGSEQAIELLQPSVEAHPRDAELVSLLGSAYARAHRYPDAVQRFEQAARIAPDNPHIRRQLALSRFAAGNRQQAIQTLKSSFDASTDGMELGMLLGLMQLEVGAFEEVFALAHAYQERFPQSPFPYMLEGAAQRSAGDLEAARASFEQAVRADADFLPAQFSLAELDRRQGNLERVKQRYLQVLQAHPGRPVVMLRLSALAESQGNLVEAIEWLEKIRQRHPDAVSAQLHLVRLYLDKDDPAAGAVIAEQLRELYPKDLRVLEVLGLSQLKKDEPDKAVATFQYMASIATESADRLYHVAQLQITAGDLDGAEASLRRVQTLEPLAPRVSVTLVRLRLQRGQIDQAWKLVRQLQRSHPGTAESYIALGEVLTHQEKFRDAADAFAKALKKDHQAPTALRLVEALEQAGARREAVRTLEAWTEGHPADRNMKLKLAREYAALGRTTPAIEVYENVLRNSPQDAAVLNNLALAYLKAGDPRALEFARRAFTQAPHNPAMLDTLGWILVQQGAAEEGLRLLREAHSRASTEPEVRYHLAVALHRLGRTEETKRELQALLSMPSKSGGLAEARSLWEEISQ